MIERSSPPAVRTIEKYGRTSVPKHGRGTDIGTARTLVGIRSLLHHDYIHQQIDAISLFYTVGWTHVPRNSVHQLVHHGETLHDIIRAPKDFSTHEQVGDLGTQSY